MKKIISVALSFALCSSVFSTDISKYLRTAPNVDRSMLSADYWISRSIEPEKVIISADEIMRLNKEAQDASAADEGKFAYYASSKKNKSISKTKLLELMDFNFGADYYIEGAKVTQFYKDDLLAYRNLDAIKDTNDVGYAFILRRGGLRLLPTADILTFDEVRSFYDEMQNSSVLMNEPVIVLHQTVDSAWYFVLTSYCSGWVPSSNIAFCHGYDEWNSYRNPADFLVVSENKFRLDYDWVNDRISEVEVSMGTKLQLVPVSDYKTSYEGREAYDNYIVRIPDRSQSGYLIFHNAYIPLGKSVSIGYVPYTRENLLRMAFSTLGELTKARVREMFDFMADLPLSGHTKNSAIRAVTTALKFAHSRELIEKDLTEGLVWFAENYSERKILSPELARAVFSVEWSDRRAKLANMVAMCTGMRAGEIRALRVCDIGGGVISVAHSWNDHEGLKEPKNGEARTVQFPFPRIEAELFELQESSPFKDDGFIFFSTIKGKPIDSDIFVDGLRDALEKTGMTKEEAKGYVFHSWRHFFATYLSDKLEAKLLQRQTGHKTRAMLEHYASHRTDGEAKAVISAQLETFANIIPV